MSQNTNTQKQGLIIGVATFVFWGVAPVFFKFLQSVPATTIIAHRIIWSALFLLLFLVIREKKQLFKTIKLPLKQILALLFTGILVTSNWLVFVWAVNHDQIISTSLGYFINPLVNILLGMLFFGERMTRLQWLAMLIATASTVYFGIYIGQPPWIALMLGFSFGFYGLFRKKLAVRPLVGLLWETLLLVIPAIIYLLEFAPDYAFNGSPSTLSLLLLSSGIVTILPLIGFNIAAKKLSLIVIGFIQYIAPTLSFLIAVIFYGETFTHGHQVAFSGIWLALAIISITAMLSNRKSKSQRS